MLMGKAGREEEMESWGRLGVIRQIGQYGLLDHDTRELTSLMGTTMMIIIIIIIIAFKEPFKTQLFNVLVP